MNDKLIRNILSEQLEKRRQTTIEVSPETVDQLVRDPFGDTSPLCLKRMEEEDYQRIPLLNSVRYLADMIEKEGNLKLTRKWEQVKTDNDKLLRLIFETFTQKLNWAYFDGYRSGNAGQFAFGVSLALVDKFGSHRLGCEMYGEVYCM